MLRCLLFFTIVGLAGAETPSGVMTRPVKQLVSETFDDPAVLGKSWPHHYSDSVVKDGQLIAKQTPGASHGAVLETLVDFKDALIRFDFAFDGSTSFNVPIDDKKYKGSHAGHICRLSFSPTSLLLGDDKEGVMRNDLFEARRSDDPAKKSAAEKELKGRSVRLPFSFKKGETYAVVLEILGDEMVVSINGEPAGYLKSPGLAHASKTDFGFTVNGQSVVFDNLEVWSVEESPEWKNQRDSVAKLSQAK